MLARHASSLTRRVALGVAATALAAMLGTVLVKAVTDSAVLGTSGGPQADQTAPALESGPPPMAPAVSDQSAPPNPTLAPATSALPATPDQSNPPADATRLPFEALPVESVNPSFQPGGNLRPPYASIPPQN
jgi:hypothetical protein